MLKIDSKPLSSWWNPKDALAASKFPPQWFNKSTKRNRPLKRAYVNKTNRADSRFRAIEQPRSPCRWLQPSASLSLSLAPPLSFCRRREKNGGREAFIRKLTALGLLPPARMRNDWGRATRERPTPSLPLYLSFLPRRDIAPLSRSYKSSWWGRKAKTVNSATGPRSPDDCRDTRRGRRRRRRRRRSGKPSARGRRRVQQRASACARSSGTCKKRPRERAWLCGCASEGNCFCAPGEFDFRIMECRGGGGASAGSRVRLQAVINSASSWRSRTIHFFCLLHLGLGGIAIFK